jgi:CopG antitoxin of type II toxin-antitoxin system
MDKSKSSISGGQSYKDIAEFWDSHDLADYWEQTKPVEFEVDIQSEDPYCQVDVYRRAAWCVSRDAAQSLGARKSARTSAC